MAQDVRGVIGEIDEETRPVADDSEAVAGGDSGGET